MTSAWLHNLWGEAEAKCSFDRLPEEAVYRAETQGHKVSSADIAFLAARVRGEDRLPAIAATRLLGLLAEDDQDLADRALPVLHDALSHDDVRTRYHAAKALWVVADRRSVPVLLDRLVLEKNQEVHDVMTQAKVVIDFICKDRQSRSA